MERRLIGKEEGTEIKIQRLTEIYSRSGQPPKKRPSDEVMWPDGADQVLSTLTFLFCFVLKGRNRSRKKASCSISSQRPAFWGGMLVFQRVDIGSSLTCRGLLLLLPSLFFEGRGRNHNNGALGNGILVMWPKLEATTKGLWPQPAGCSLFSIEASGHSG